MNTTTKDHDIEQNLAMFITTFIIMICLYGVGVFLHIKVIMVSNKEKGLTWKIDISNSIIVLVLHAHFIYIHIISYLTPDLVLFTGEWLCYISKVMVHYSVLYLSGHSMIISMMKYVIILYEEKVRHVKDEVKRGFFWINILHPVLQISLQLALNQDYFYEYDGYLVINQCLGKTNVSKVSWYSMCEFTKPVQNRSIAYVLYIFKRTICTAQVVLLLTIAFNIFEMFLYWRIFSYMRR